MHPFFLDRGLSEQQQSIAQRLLDRSIRDCRAAGYRPNCDTIAMWANACIDEVTNRLSDYVRA